MAAEASIKDNKHTRLLGKDPETGFDIYATIGKFCPIVKLMLDKGKPRCAPIKEPLTLENITLDDALELFEFPKDIGKYGNKKIVLKRGEHGFYLAFGDKTISTTKSEMTLEEAIELIKSKEKKALATFSDDNKTYYIYKGKDPYPDYICMLVNKTKKTYNIPLPKDEVVENLTLERVTEIINNKYKRKPTEKAKVPAKANAPIKKAVKKVPVKKKVVKKAAKKKIFVSND